MIPLLNPFPTETSRVSTWDCCSHCCALSWMCWWGCHGGYWGTCPQNLRAFVSFLQEGLEAQQFEPWKVLQKSRDSLKPTEHLLSPDGEVTCWKY